MFLDFVQEEVVEDKTEVPEKEEPAEPPVEEKENVSISPETGKKGKRKKQRSVKHSHPPDSTDSKVEADVIPQEEFNISVNSTASGKT